MQLRSLRVFCDVVRRRNFSAAAIEHGMTQGAASQAVQHLEDLVEVKLLDRSTRPFGLTAEGQKFFEGANAILRNFDALIDEIRGNAADVSGHVSVGSIYSIGLSYLPAIEEEFRSRFPNASIQTHMAHPDEVYRAVEQGTVDIGLVSYPESTKTILATPWREEPMVLVGSPRHRLASQSVLSPSELSQVGLVAFAPELPIRHAIDRALRAVNITMRIVVELDNIDSVKHAVVVNSGLAFLPELTVQHELAAGSLKRLPCADFSLTRPIGYLQRRDKTLSRVAREFQELLVPAAHCSSDDDGGAASASTSVRHNKSIRNDVVGGKEKLKKTRREASSELEAGNEHGGSRPAETPKSVVVVEHSDPLPIV